MIHVIDRTNADGHGEMLRAFASLRYQTFVAGLGWRIPCREPGLEEDQFDDGNAVYLLVTAAGGRLAGGARLLDTSRRSLLGEVFSHLVHGRVPADPKVFEVTRFVVAPEFRTPAAGSADRRIDVCAALLWGLQAYGHWTGLRHLVSVSYVGMEPIFRRAGYRFHRLGDVLEIDGARVAAFQHDIDANALERSRQRTGAPCYLLTSRGPI
jgi:acyl-homoserine lactone synthase